MFKREEVVIEELTALFESRGFLRYKPSCFEEYALYQENKDFLIGKNVITFSGLNGKLLAMRPDVSLSLIRHSDVPENSAKKYFYNEKVYRQGAGSRDYKEISQMGAEVVGDIDGLCQAELTVLICQTLGAVNQSYALDISHMEYTEGFLEEFGVYADKVSEFLKKKSVHEFIRLADEVGFSEKLREAFVGIAAINGVMESSIKEAELYALNKRMKSAVCELKEMIALLGDSGVSDKINLNFSASNNADYYNGIIFNGYLEGVSQCVLSGGRYDKLLAKFSKKGGAIGFALYIGEIERFFKPDAAFVDCLIIYDDNSQRQALQKQADLIAEGKSVRLSRVLIDGLKYGSVIYVRNAEAKI